jgi:hypothetical protein
MTCQCFKTERPISLSVKVLKKFEYSKKSYFCKRPIFLRRSREAFPYLQMVDNFIFFYFYFKYETLVTHFALFFQRVPYSFINFNRKCEVWLMNLLCHFEKAYCSEIISP